MNVYYSILYLLIINFNFICFQKLEKNFVHYIINDNNQRKHFQMINYVLYK